MTTYVAGGQRSATNGDVGVKAGTYPIRIATIAAPTSGAGGYFIYLVSSITLSGGTSVTPVPLRAGAPASTATCQVGAATVSGSSLSLDVATSAAWTPAFDLIVAPGAGIKVTVGASAYVIFYFEEIRQLSWPL